MSFLFRLAGQAAEQQFLDFSGGGAHLQKTVAAKNGRQQQDQQDKLQPLPAATDLALVKRKSHILVIQDHQRFAS